MDSNLKNNLYSKKHITKKRSFSNSKKKLIKSIEKIIHKNFIHKYQFMPSHYDLYVTNNIIYNDRTHIVSRFKEYLVIDDGGEFLKRYYTKDEVIPRLKKFFKFYFLYSKVFPNYTPIYENKFIYSNIHQKQKMIDLQERMENERKHKIIEIEIGDGNTSVNKDVFASEIIDSLLNTTNKEVAEILFNINRDNLVEEENKFKDGVNNIVDKISSYQNKRKNSLSKKDFYIRLNSINSKINKTNRNNKMALKTIKTNINNNISNKENISQNLNNQFFLSKILKNSIKKKIVSKNKVKENKTNPITKRSSYKEKKSNNNSRNKIINEKLIIKKLENDILKIKKRFLNHKKNISQNMSPSIQSKKDFSLTKKNSSVFNLNNKNPSPSISNLNLLSNPSSQVISTKISPSNSIKKQMKKQAINSKILTNNKDMTYHKNLIIKIHNDKERDKYSRNKQLQTSTTTSNLVNNIIYRLNNKYKDSRNKKYKNISINTISKVDRTSPSNASKTKINKKIINNNTIKILEYDFQTNKEYDCQTNKDDDIKYKLKRNIKSYKNNYSINFENGNKTYHKLISEKILRNNRINSQNNTNIYSTNNILNNTYKRIKIKKLKRKSMFNKLNFCYSSRNLGINDINKSKLIKSCNQSKQNSTSRSKNFSRDNITNKNSKNIILKINKTDKLHNMKLNSFIKKSFITSNNK